MATTHPCLVGQRISLPQFHLLFNSKPPNHELTTSKRSNLCVSLALPHSFASSTSNRNPRKSSLSCLRRNCAAVDGGETSSSEEDKWDWDRWSRHFAAIEEIDGVVSLLKVQLEEAIEREDFEEAAKLKAAIGEASVNDAVAEIMGQLQDAIGEERYHDASKLCRQTGSGLVGWWVCYPQDSEEPFGRIVRITPGVGRFIGKSYSPRQLVTAAAGTPLFEIFVVKDTDGEYVMQVVYLQHAKQKPATPENTSLSSQQSSNDSVESPSILDAGGSEVKVDKKKDKLLSAEEPTEEGIQNVIKFLKDKIPGLKLMKVMDVELPDEEIVGSDDDLVELVGEVIEEAGSADEEEDDDDSIENITSMDSADNGKDLNPKVFIGGVLHSTEDSSVEDELVRVLADITDNERDSFTLHVPGRRKSDIGTSKNTVSKEKVTALAAQGLSDLMPPEVAKAFWGSERPSLKVSRNVREIVKLAISQAQKGNRLSEYTRFNRIITPESDLDPFDGLYVGSFGPYGTEIVQLKRKYGNWNDAEESDSSDIEFFEYVEAVKLTGDPNVPAGQVTFRARIGKGSRMRDRGMYPEEMGVLASYMGEGRIADFGFKNPRWVGGQLLKLNGKGMGPYVTGGDLGFLYIGPEKSFMVVFNRLRLPE
ncbi:hypothetical protein Bca52824_044414 [Brassica carinata]|uniref:Uncharacterized protein n=1 Tax=Brassica carinata TaxID=52824 RepID=A0A8X7S2T0_BRACI|nr:hypothetical protein Bca52824_044414 [Brassica carinata]